VKEDSVAPVGEAVPFVEELGAWGEAEEDRRKDKAEDVDRAQIFAEFLAQKEVHT
jgi:hypothetical protein